jgi:hypothetical protein
MDDSEKAVYEYLMARRLGPIIYQPDGNVPPDWLVDGRIAVEVRRLNQNETTDSGYRGLEETSKPLTQFVRRALAEAGPPIDGTTWFVHYSYQRPLPPFKELKRRFSTALETARARQDLQDVEIPVTPKFHLSFARASETHPQLFLPGLHDDHD